MGMKTHTIESFGFRNFKTNDKVVERHANQKTAVFSVRFGSLRVSWNHLTVEKNLLEFHGLTVECHGCVARYKKYKATDLAMNKIGKLFLENY